MRTIYLILLMVFGLMSCLDNTEENTYDDIGVTTGINLTDDNGSSLGRYNLPNDNASASLVYPNPARNVLSVYNMNKITSIHFVPTKCQNKGLDETIIQSAKSLRYSLEEIESNQIKKLNINSEINVNINLEEFEDGFYKVFVISKNQQVEWVNIFKHSNGGGSNPINLMNSFCN